MSSNFFAMVERMKLIDRWALMNNTGKENIAEHSHTVAVIAHALALIGNKKFGRSYNAERCALLALTDIGFAEAVAKKLAESDEAHYGEAAKRLTIKAARAAERRKELKQHEKNVRTGKKKPHQEEPQPAPAAKAKSAEKSESKRPRGAVKHGRTRAEREKAHRAAEKQRAARRFAHSRPVKKGKGSIKKDSKQRSQHTEVQ